MLDEKAHHIHCKLRLGKHVALTQVHEDEPVLQAFKLIRKNRIGGVRVVESGGRKAIGNISLRDVQFLLTAPEIYRDYRDPSNVRCGRRQEFGKSDHTQRYHIEVSTRIMRVLWRFLSWCVALTAEQSGLKEVKKFTPSVFFAVLLFGYLVLETNRICGF
ncbi:hypothetical protein V6N12_024515 [Hibiscus sabdariffa]|uniref:CBS domain-containing protein n=1 Tax=Hibiscus sabdariffa TaxID=183260 RepID=A0ABR2G103_9ROSI